jgi:hypothetical protein
MPCQAITPESDSWAEPSPAQGTAAFDVETAGDIVAGDRLCLQEPIWVRQWVDAAATRDDTKRVRRRDMRYDTRVTARQPVGGGWAKSGSCTIVADVADASEGSGVTLSVLWSRGAAGDALPRPGTTLRRDWDALSRGSIAREEWIDEEGRWSRDEEAVATSAERDS